MKKEGKTAQLQIRVSAAQKKAIAQRAREHGMSMSDWVLSRALPSAQTEFETLVAELAASNRPSFVFSELLDLLAGLGSTEFQAAVAKPPAVALSPYWENYLAATIEHAAARMNVTPPAWTAKVRPLEEPAFGSTLRSLRLHLLINSPPAFCRRNIFIDSSVGGRV